MLERGSARKVIIHLNEDTASDRAFTYQQVFEFLFERGVAGATLTRPNEGFGGHHRLHDRDGRGGSRQHLPVRIEFTEKTELAEALLEQLCELVQDGLIEMQETTIVKAAKQEAPL
jgi:uncharacterized protein